MTSAVADASQNVRGKARGLRGASPSVNFARLVALALLGGPIVAGLLLTVLPGFGVLPALGGENLSLAPWKKLLAEPGLAASLRLTIFVGFASSAAALALAFAVLARVAARPSGGALEGWLAPLLASPHSAIAIGLAFLIAPSGWIVRLASPWTGFATPPDVAIVGDPCGFALTLGLAVKETPFLIAVGLAALRQFPALAQMRAARALGYRSRTAFLLIVAPQLYARMRLPIAAVLAYGLSVVDMAIVLGPTHPAPLSMLGLHWFLSPDLGDVFVASAAATLQLGVVSASILVWRAAEALVRRALVARARFGTRSGIVEPVARGLALAAGALIGLGFASLVVLALWALAWRWPFPNAWPESFTAEIVRRIAPQLARPLGATVALAVVSTAAAIALAVACLEGDDRRGRRGASAAVYLPLLLPQLSFLFGVETLFSAARLDGTFAAVMWAHALFVFPYVLLALEGPWGALDPRYARAARALGTGAFETLVRVKLPILAGPLALALAIGVSVSAAQYLSTLFAGGGRVETLTTEALALVNGGDRRLSAIVGLMQALFPFAVYVGALVAPRVLHRKRSGLVEP